MIEFKNVSFFYENGNANGQLVDINLSIPKGQVILIAGESGCGKTTLIRLINGLIPNYYEGTWKGTVTINGTSISEKPLYDTAALVGSVFQNPRSQFFSTDTTSELAFGCENLGLPKEEIDVRLHRVTSDFQIQSLLGRSIFSLSGGEKQKIACGSVAMIDPDIFVLDEPSSNLDMKAIGELAKVIELWKKQNKTVIIAEHRLYYLMDIADRVLYMSHGKILEDMSSGEFRTIPETGVSAMGLRSLVPESFPEQKSVSLQKELLEITGFSFSYQNVPALEVEHLDIPKGSIVGVIGNNGAGKTTFARCLCGLEKKARGQLRMNGKAFSNKERLNECFMVMQNPSHQLFTEDVMDEVLLSMDESRGEAHSTAERILERLHLEDFKERHPMSLSGGQQQRVAIASAVASGRSILVFDEPTSGLDFRHMKDVADVLEQLRTIGKTIFIITHDPELIERCCNFFMFMEAGKISWHGTWTGENVDKLKDFFSGTKSAEKTGSGRNFRQPNEKN